MKLIYSTVATFFAILWLGVSAHAATFTYSGIVTEVNLDATGAGNQPFVGEEVTFTISIDGAPDDPVNFPELFPFSVPVISIETAGGLTASVAQPIVSGMPNATSTGYSISTLGNGITGLTGIPTFSQNLHSAGFSFDEFIFADPGAPTVSEMIAALTVSSLVTGSFRAGTQNTDTLAFGDFRAAFTTAPSEVPLPGAALFLLTGIIPMLRKKTPVCLKPRQ